jgi:hypothetical protein|tara:strand:- start:937 stop:1461 length:525 start_codon:yes stop_codon:yes gene_type:complete
MMDSNDHFEHYKNDEEVERELNQTKTLSLTKNEALFLSDTFTLLVEHDREGGSIQLPARGIIPSAGMSVPIEMIQKIGMAVLLTTDPKNITQLTSIDFTVSELFLMRECCQSYVRMNKEPVGYNLARKIYRCLLEDTIQERVFFNKLTKDIDISLDKEERKDANTGTNNDRTSS